MTCCMRRYATGASITGSDALIHDFYASETPNPVSSLPPHPPPLHNACGTLQWA